MLILEPTAAATSATVNAEDEKFRLSKISAQGEWIAGEHCAAKLLNLRVSFRDLISEAGRGTMCG